LTYSAEIEPLSEMLVLTPTGVYRGRVKKGVEMVLGHYAEQVTPGMRTKPQTKIRVVLVVGKDWIDEPTYREAWVDDIKRYVSTWKDTFDVTCQEQVIPFETEEYLSGWLLGELSSFFKGPGMRKAYVDLTSGLSLSNS
jgi:hypothetical protein